MVSRSKDSIKVTCSVQHTHRLIASQHSWHTTFFLMIWSTCRLLQSSWWPQRWSWQHRSVQLKGPTGPSTKTTVWKNRYIVKQNGCLKIHRWENKWVRGGAVSLFDTCDANNLHFSGSGAESYGDEAVHWEGTLQRMFKICHHFCIIQSQIYWRLQCFGYLFSSHSLQIETKSFSAKLLLLWMWHMP